MHVPESMCVAILAWKQSAISIRKNGQCCALTYNPSMRSGHRRLLSFPVELGGCEREVGEKVTDNTGAADSRWPCYDSLTIASHWAAHAGPLAAEPIILPPMELLATQILAGALMGLELAALGLGCLLQSCYVQVWCVGSGGAHKYFMPQGCCLQVCLIPPRCSKFAVAWRCRHSQGRA